MTKQQIIAAAALVLGLAACATPETYPVSGEECNPDDPVQSFEAADCLPPQAGPGTF